MRLGHFAVQQQRQQDDAWDVPPDIGGVHAHGQQGGPDRE